MAVSFNVPKSPARSILTIDEFLGVDFTNGPANVEDKKSPNCVNMIRDVPGKVRKCMGYETIASYVDENEDPLPINGYHMLRGEEKGFLHAGADILYGNVWLYDSANNTRSKAWQFEKKLYMLDGKELLCLSNEEAAESETTVGYHTRNITGDTFTETVTLEENDFINFYLPYECEKVTITYTDDQEEEQTITEDLDDVTAYLFENTYGDYEFEITFDASYTHETKSFTGNPTSVGTIGDGSRVTVDFEKRCLYNHEITISNGTWTSTEQTAYTTYSKNIPYEDDYTVSVHLSPNSEYQDRVRNTTKVSNTEYYAVFVDTDESPFLLYPGDYIYLMGWVGDFEVKKTIEVTYTEDGGEPISETIDGGYGIRCYLPNNSNKVRSYSYIKLTAQRRISTFTYVSELTLRYFPDAYSSYANSLKSIAIKNTYGHTYEGLLQYVVNSSMLGNGFFDGRSGTFVDSGVIHKVEKVSDLAYIPTVTISKDPEGGGTPYEDLNLLTSAFTETFLGKPSVKDYNLSFKDLDEEPPIVEVMDENGDFQPKEYETDFTVDYEEGIVTFTTAPGESPLTGEDNVKITAYRTIEGYADRINHCTIGTLFGVSGALDRLFVSGNPDYINYDWYSGQYDPTYFTDTSYSMLGTSASAIVGYSIISNYLAAHKDYMERDQNIILREGDLVESEPSFRIINTLQGAGAVAPFSFAYLETEPLFLTRLGIYAVTAQDISGEKYAQNRSYFVDGKLLDEPNMDNAFGFVYKDMYWLCLNNVAYILDGLQPIHTDKSKPYATRQYAAFYRTNLPARIMWEEDGRLFFGTEDGRVCRFHNDKYALESYNDDGEPIEAMWETPDIDGKLFYKNKTLRYIALRLDSAIATSVNIWVMNHGLWQFVKKDDTSGRYLSFSHLVFSKLSFSGDKTQHTFSSKVRVKKVDKFRLRVGNDDLNEPFGLYNIAFEYVENGNYKG